MLKFKSEKINDLVRRSIFGFIMLLLVFPILFITYYANVTGKIIGLIVFGLALAYSVYEIIQHFQLNKLSTIVLSLIPLYAYFLPVHVIETLLFNNNLNDNKESSILVKLISEQFQDYNILIVLVVVVIIFLLELKNNNKKQVILNSIITFIVIYLATIFFKLIWIINIFNIYLLLFLGFIAVFSDVFGYFAGTLFGQKIFHFSLKISPNKSLEGFISAFIFSALFISLIVFFGHSIIPPVSKLVVFQTLLIIILPIVAIIGDLFFSFIKRLLKIKDFSKIIKSHGGVFDRFDSTSFVFLFFAIILIISF
ncbi:phosphatidate cytidylyltransferase [Mesomycoplasma bovoculi]|uniref:Phosphatidate cytidylyltransferase n=1 Tax=Mesomycoplasma bovoculi M165/69 TaxID=743966 RepID=W5V1F2_9BACT|nr:phosphatidate cytidylyltransferase [Mesomycoplasma bovoculi]AHH45568.1 phosphatidate cytidylyltransferase synthase [Mesomycoplasma bovoculi M165/69]